MEIKIYCQCGAKYKFDVEPLNGKLPGPVKCPVCQVDGTTQGNQIIQERLALPEVPHTAAVAMAAAPAAFSPPTAGVLRVASGATPEPSSEISRSESVNLRPIAKAARASEPTPWKKIVTVALICFMVFGFARKWYRKARLTSAIAGIVGEVTVKGDTSEGIERKWTLPTDDGAMLLVRHTNAMAIAEACVEYQRTQMRKNLAIENGAPEFVEGDVKYAIWPAHHGSVELSGSLFWDGAYLAEFCGAAQHISQRLQAITVAALMGDDAATGIVGIYENGIRKFWYELDIRITKNDLEEIIRTEGNDWVTAKGFKPEKSFEKFSMEDANNLVRHLGFKFESRPEPKNMVLLREGATPPRR